MNHRAKIAAAGLLLPWAASASAADGLPSDWHFAVNFYAWVSDLQGSVNAAEATHPADIDLSHGDVLEHLKFAAFGSFEARKDRLVFMSDLTYAHIGASSGIGPGDVDLVDAELDATTFTATFLGGYQVARGSVDVDLLVGARVVVNDTELVLSGPQRTAEGDVTETWIDPIIATQIAFPVSEKAALNFYGDMGGGSSEFTWQAIAGISYRLSGRWSLTAAWRYYSVDYDKDYFLYDVTQSGPVVGAKLDF
jgi:opacity protein-like surface antigen